MTETFPNKALAVRWARQIEAEMDARKFKEVRGLENITLKELIERYEDEIGGQRPFGKIKAAVLNLGKRDHGDTTVAEVTDDFLTDFVCNSRKGKDGKPISGITISIDFTYLSGVFKTAAQLWKLPVSQEPFQIARANMGHLKISTKSKERKRRPTEKELGDLCDYLDKHSTLPMRDIINFAFESAMRIDEITQLPQVDLNREERTILIRDRKHPREKEGNDQMVPLLGRTFAIVCRQPAPGEITEVSRIFPVLTNTITTIFPRAKAALGIKDLKFHDLHHEGVSRLFEQGYSIPEFALVSGHRDWKMLMPYTHITAKGFAPITN